MGCCGRSSQPRPIKVGNRHVQLPTRQVRVQVPGAKKCPKCSWPMHRFGRKMPNNTIKFYMLCLNRSCKHQEDT